MSPTFVGCDDCSDYGARRMKVIFPAIKRVAAKHHIAPPYLAALYFNGVHARHLSGKAL